MISLIIVESPTKAKTLNRFLGSEYSVVATMGHIKDLPKSKLGVDVEHDFAPDYVVVKKRGDVIKKIKDEAKKAKNIYIATDPDREGEAIASHVYEVISDKDTKILSEKGKKKKIKNHLVSKYLNIPVSRITFHEITKNAVEEAIANPHKIDKNLVDAQIARRVLDRLVGYKLSPVLWKKVRRGLSAGRVQTVAVRLIVEREREILAFKPTEYWEIYVQVEKVDQVDEVETDARGVKASTPRGWMGGSFIVKLIKINDKKAEIGDGETAKKITSELEKSDYKVVDVKKKEVKKSPYPPYTTSTLTQAASRIMGWSAKKTMSVAQGLYEEGLITYHRTDSTNLAITAVMGCRDYIKKEYGNEYLPEKPRFYKTTSKVAQEAHEAIRPTDVTIQSPTTNYQPQDAARLYSLIWKRFVACQMNPAIYDETTIDVQALGYSKVETSAQSLIPNSYLLRASGQIIKFDGWKVLYQSTNPKSEILNSKHISNANDPNSSNDFHPDTEHAEVEGSNIQSPITNHMPMDTEVITQLPDVSNGEILGLIKVDPQQKFTQPPARFTEAMLIKTLEKLGIGRPSTYAPTINTIQIRGYVEKDEGKFIPTSVGFAVNDFLLLNFPETFEYSFTAKMEKELDDIANGSLEWVKMMKDFYTPFERKVLDVEKNAERMKVAVETLGKKCPECKEGDQVIRSGKFGKFISCSRFPDCKFTARYEQRINIKCPGCKEGEVIIKKSKRGRKFFGCNRYPACKFASWNKPKINEGTDEQKN